MGCGQAPAPDVVEAEQAVTHTCSIGLREEARAAATDLVDAGYDTPEQIDRLEVEQLSG